MTRVSLRTAVLALLVTAPAGAAEPVWLAGPAASADGQGVVLAQSWASWCHSCAGIAPALAELAQAHPGVRYEATSVEDSLADARAAAARIAQAAQGRATVAWGGPDHARRWRLTTVPTLRVLVDGRELARVEGHPGAGELASLGEALARAAAGAPR